MDMDVNFFPTLSYFLPFVIQRENNLLVKNDTSELWIVEEGDIELRKDKTTFVMTKNY